ncbi:hypothetical protein SAMN05421640_3047 [Ekhidna lutea]|uniref:Uncharacterized protein n=1 Tax=Ekhidna lutea TaxID=447679 RepID=A0A239LAT5_EKHLU|nr:hypothetical protein [Ekhidna lutea]SNT26664.1 hypothetical protein SAMN05421640_3047 [Ekhidna lutea]
MKFLFIAILYSFFQSPVTIVKNNGDEIELTNVLLYQTTAKGTPDVISYSYRGAPGKVNIKEVKRISFKENLGRKKGVTTFKAILVKRNNDKLEVEVNLVKVEGTNKEGKKESMNFSSVDKISF